MLRGIKIWLLRALVLAVVSSVAYDSYAVTITRDPGGWVDDYVAKYSLWRSEGRAVRIAGDCNSACTLAIGMIPAARLCAEPQARFGFHSASLSDGNTMKRIAHDQRSTSFIWRSYPPVLRQMLFKRWGWDGDDPVKGEHPEIMFIKSPDIYKFVRPCV